MNLNTFDQRYKEAVEQMAIKGSEKTFNNSGPIHASIVMTSIYRNAKDNIKLYTKDLQGEIGRFLDYMTSMNDYINSNKSFQILINERPHFESDLFDTILNASKTIKGVELRFASPTFVKEVDSYANKNSHFCIADDKMFRLEYDNYNHQALCGFNSPKVVSKFCLLYTSPSPRDQRGSRMPSSA